MGPVKARNRPKTRRCDVCSRTYPYRLTTSRYCSSTCRSKASRRGGVGENGGKNGASAAIPADDPLLLATRRELEAAGMLERYQGQLALRLAQEVVKVSLYGSGAELARVSKAFGETWASAMKAPASLSPGLGVVDELTARRQKRRGR